MARINNYLRGESVAVTSSDTTSLTISSIDIIPTSGTNTLLVADDIIYVICADTGQPIQITLNGNVNFNSNRLTFASTTVSQLIPAGSIVILDREYKYDSLFRKRVNAHCHCYMTDNTHGNDVLPNFSQWNFNINAGAVLSDGDSKPNRWTSQYGFFIAPTGGAIIEKIIYNFSTNATTGHNFTFSLWDMPTDANDSKNQTISLIDKLEATSQNDQNYVFNRVYTTPYTLDEGNVIFPTIKKTGEYASSSDKFYGDVEIYLSYDPRL
jgi:hypothetical protein